MRSEPLHDLGVYPADIDLLKAARAALRIGLVPQIGTDPRGRSAVRQLDAILRELLHRAGDFPAMMHDRAAAARPILREARLLQRQLRIVRGAGASRVAAGRRGATTSGQAAYSSIAAELCATMPALWRAWQSQPTSQLQRRLEALGRRIVAWENGTARAMAADPPDTTRRLQDPHPASADLPALQSCLRAHEFGAPDLEVTNFARLSGGFSRATWRLDVQDRVSGPRSYVVRQQMQGGIVQGVAADVKHEYPLLRVLHAAGVPVPEPLLLVTGRNPLRQDFMVVAHLPGQAIGNSVGDSTTADAHLLESVAGTLARLHGVDWTRHHAELRGTRTWHRSPGVGLKQLVVELVDRWHAFIRDNIGIDSPSVETGMAWLRANVPDRIETPRIVHGDVTFANMLAEHGRLTALLDWEVACLGDPAKDLAHFKPVVEARMPWQSFVASYLAAGGRPVDDRTLRYYEVFKAVTHVAVNYVARGRRFSRAPEARPELTEIGLLQLPVYMRQLQAALEG